MKELRDSWDERRLVRSLATAHDHDSQLRLLETLHRWASESCEDVAKVYGEGVAAWVDPIGPKTSDGAASFHVMLAGHAVIFLLQEHADSPRWHVTATVAPPGGQQAALAGPERRHGHWTRGRIEDLFLGLLSAHERSAAGQ